MKQLKILFIEPFYGGSHRNFADGLVKYSTHNFKLFTLPDRYWKWRMRGAALYFSEKIKNPEDYDLLFTSDMMSLSDLKMLWGKKCPASIVYFHENQLSYPLPEGEKMDYQFGFTDITTGLAADRLLFNSYFHMDSFFKNMPQFIRKMPEYKPLWVIDKIKAKSSVLYPGCCFPVNEESKIIKDSQSGRAPLIIWNHRWEFDKCPERFFKALEQVDRKMTKRGIKVPFNIALLGENFQMMPKAFIEAKEHWGDRIIQYGYCRDREEYINWLKRADIVISTSIQENFGISIVEAIRYGAFPLLPDRLSYPELIPQAFHNDFIYEDDEALSVRLENILADLQNLHGNESIDKISKLFADYSWEKKISEYDKFFSEICIEM